MQSNGPELDAEVARLTAGHEEDAEWVSIVRKALQETTQDRERALQAVPDVPFEPASDLPEGLALEVGRLIERWRRRARSLLVTLYHEDDGVKQARLSYWSRTLADCADDLQAVSSRKCPTRDGREGGLDALRGQEPN